jgi:hypothetical protein
MEPPRRQICGIFARRSFSLLATMTRHLGILMAGGLVAPAIIALLSEKELK